MQFYIDPILVNLGFLQIRYYGLVYAIAFLLLYIVLIRKKVLTEEEASSLVLHCGLGMLIFARLFHILFDNLSYYLAHPIEVFFIWQGGLAFFGGALGLFLGGYWYAKKRGKSLVSYMQIADYAALVGCFALIFGRIANLINQELVGRVTTIAQTPWCFEFVSYFTSQGPVFEGVCRHPYQIYASISHLVLFIVLILLYVYLQNHKLRVHAGEKHYVNHGIIFFVFIVGYSVLRFITDFWRDDAVVFIGLTHWQIISAIIFFVSLFLFRQYYLILEQYRRTHRQNSQHDVKQNHTHHNTHYKKNQRHHLR
jgi:phosphatidylglycerol---prolipoprotein diacylglyceryl transferase